MMQKIILFFFYVLFLFYLEILCQYFLFDNFLTVNLLNIFLFILPISLIFYFLSSLASEKINRVVIIAITFIVTILYFSQFIFYKTYDSIYSLSATQQAHAIGEFLSFVIQQVINNILASILFLLPLILVIVFYKKLLLFKPLALKYLAIPLILFISIHLIIINTLSTEGMYANHNLYYKINAPTLTAERIGLLTTMRLDVLRSITDFQEQGDFFDIKDPKKDDEDKKEEEEIIEYNKMTIDWEKLIAQESDETLQEMHRYFQNQSPTNKNEWTGKFEGKNLIWILAESLDPIAIDKELTPTLYKLANEGLNFTNFYTPIFLSTVDGEYMTKTGLLPKAGVWSLYRSRDNYLPFTIGHQLKKQDYLTTAYHNGQYTYYNRHLSHPNLGYEEYIAGSSRLDIDYSIWPQSDLEMIDVTVPDFIEKSPFAIYYLTISGHLEYNRYNQMALRNWHYVEDLPYSTPIKCFLAQHVEFDKALESLVAQLEEEGLAEETVIAISSDHWPYGLRDANYLNERSDIDRTDFFNRDRLPFIIWHEGIEAQEIDKLSSTIDILPTLLNLFGLEYDSRLMIGQDIFADTDPMVIFSNRNWLTEKGKYYKSQEEFIPHNDEENISDKYVESINQEVYNRFRISRLMLDKNYYYHLFK